MKRIFILVRISQMAGSVSRLLRCHRSTSAYCKRTAMSSKWKMKVIWQRNSVLRTPKILSLHVVVFREELGFKVHVLSCCSVH